MGGKKQGPKGYKFINPFDGGVSYDAFLKSLPEDKTATEHLKDVCSKDQLEWLEVELTQYKNKK